jgi:hypothetical protein
MITEHHRSFLVSPHNSVRRFHTILLREPVPEGTPQILDADILTGERFLEETPNSTMTDLLDMLPELPLIVDGPENRR